MNILKGKKYNPRKIYLLTTEITSSSYNGDGLGPRSTTLYYLAIKRNKKYYELFSKVEIKYADTSTPGFSFAKFDTPMISHVEKFEKYVINPKVKLAADELFYFITKRNADKIIFGDSKGEE